MKRRLMPVVLFLCAAAIALGAETIERLEDVRDLKGAKSDAASRPCRLVAQVIHASALRPATYVVTPPFRNKEPGVILIAQEGFQFSDGDVLAIEGETFIANGHPSIRAAKAEVVRSAPLGEARHGKYSDLRKGLLHARRIAIGGFMSEPVEKDGVTTFVLSTEGNNATCRVPGRISQSMIGKRLVLTGCVLNDYNETGTIGSPILELEDADDIKLMEDDWRTPALWAVSSILAFVLVAFTVLWQRVRRERIAAQAVAADRRRMAGELHDTIEQHLATAKILLSGALGVSGMPEEASDAVKTAAGVIAHAKIEVRDAVMDLRSEGMMNAADALRAMAVQITRGGAARVRTRLDALPRNLGSARTHDLVAIAREAVTNAIKHGRAANVAILADASENFILRILNDGAPFGEGASLGPESGHFGLFGMRERARRSNFGFSIVDEGRWKGVAITINKEAV